MPPPVMPLQINTNLIVTMRKKNGKKKRDGDGNGAWRPMPSFDLLKISETVDKLQAPWVLNHPQTRPQTKKNNGSSHRHHPTHHNEKKLSPPPDSPANTTPTNVGNDEKKKKKNEQLQWRSKRHRHRPTHLSSRKMSSAFLNLICRLLLTKVNRPWRRREKKKTKKRWRLSLMATYLTYLTTTLLHKTMLELATMRKKKTMATTICQTQVRLMMR